MPTFGPPVRLASLACLALLAAGWPSAAQQPGPAPDTPAPPAAAAPPASQPPAPEKPPAAKKEAPKSRRATRQAEKQAVAALPQTYRDWLDEVDVLIMPAEKTAFLALEKDYQRDAFIKKFWEARDLYKSTSRNEFHDRWKAMVEEARLRYKSLKDERARTLLLNGPPAVLIESSCSTLLSPMEVWYYQRSELVSFEFFIIFYQRWGAGAWQVWFPTDGIDELFSSSSDPARRTLNDIYSSCRDGDKLAAAINWVYREGIDYATLQARFSTRPQGPGGEWVASFNSYSTDLPEGAQTFPAQVAFDFPGRHQNRTVVQGLVTVPMQGLTEARLGEARSYNLSLTGEVLQDGQLFDSFRYKYDFPQGGSTGPAGSTPAPAAAPVQAASTAGGEAPLPTLPVLFQRYLRPGAYNVVLKLEDINSGKVFRTDRKVDVPQRENFVATPADPADTETARLIAEANAAIGTGETTLKIIPPRGDLQTGMLRIDTLSTGPEIAEVTFALDGKALLTKKRPPYSVELDLGSLPRTRRLSATAFDASGRQVAGDEMLLNSAGHRFRVRLSEPQKGKTYQSSLLARAETEVPDGEAIERVELYLNEDLVATVYQPPYEQPILLGKGAPAAYVRAVAYLTDGNSTENLVFINTPDYPEEVEVQYVELYTSVVDREGRPVEGLTEGDFTPFEDGVKQKILRFDRVTDLPIHAAVAIDVSASMEPALPQVQSAALQFLQEAIRPKDRGSIVTFNDHPNLAVKFTGDPKLLAGGLAGLKAERGTALYDSIVFTLYYFNGVKGQRAILLLSDGKDEGSRFSFEDALDYARRAGVTIYAIGLGADIEKKKLSRFAEETGGRSFFVKDAAELSAIYAAIEHELRSQYLIAYQSTNPGTDNGPFRAVELKVGKPGLEAKTIRGYYP